MDNVDELNESDCCGNGCANCVLNIDVKKLKPFDLKGKLSVLEKYTKFRLLDKRLHSQQVNNVLELHFKVSEITGEQYVLGMKAGYHVMMRRKLSADDNQIYAAEIEEQDPSKVKRDYLLRPYSSFWWDMYEMEFKILVDLKPQGPMSLFIQNLQIDDEVEFRGSIGTFDYTEDTKGDQQLLIISQGVAIAPIIPIVENILFNDDDFTRVLHLACFQDIDHFYFREKLDEYQRYWNYKARIYVTHEMCDSRQCVENQKCIENCRKFNAKLRYKEPIYTVRLCEEEVNRVVEPIKNASENVMVVIAGAGSFQKYFKDIMEKHNLNVYLL